MRFFTVFFIVILASLMVACTPADSAAVVELDTLPTATPRIIYVTPTRQVTAIATFAVPTDAPTAVPSDVPTSTPDRAVELAQCSTVLTTLYEQGSESCLGEPSGFFCTGGLPPEAVPADNVLNVSNSMALPGALVPVDVVTTLDTAPLLSNNSGGLMWVRLADPINVNSVALGDVTLRDLTGNDPNLTDWQAMSVITDDTPPSEGCNIQPYSMFVIQGPWGLSTNLAINGVSIQLTGSLVIQTHGTETYFISIEGNASFNVFGQRRTIDAGQQLRVPYADRSFVQPSGVPGDPELLNFDYIRNLPIPLLDRPVLLPQPAVMRTNGNVNMRAEPTVDSLLLAEVPSGQVVSVIAMNEERTWYHVRLPNSENGWMRADLIVGEIGEITLTYDATPVPPERFGDSTHGATVIAQSGANLRADPDVQFQVLRTLPEGTQVEIIARSPYSNFVQVNTGSEIGWLALVTIETTTVIQFLPIEYEVRRPAGPTPTPYFAFGGGHAYPDPRTGN